MKTRVAATAALALALFSIGILISCNKSKAPEQAQQAGGTAPPQTEQRIEKNPDRSAYFGEEHIHTSWSVDAWLMGNRLTGPASSRATNLSGPLMHDDLPTSDILFQADNHAPDREPREFGRHHGVSQ